MVEESKAARVYRFRDYVAFDVGESDTLYVSAALARQLSEEFGRYAADIESGVRFSESTLGTIELQGEE